MEEKLSLHINQPFFIASEKDEALGERVILIIESEKQLQLEDYSETFEMLSTYEKPKKVYTTPQFIYTETGKILRAATLETI